MTGPAWAQDAASAATANPMKNFIVTISNSQFETDLLMQLNVSIFICVVMIIIVLLLSKLYYYRDQSEISW